MAEVRRLIAPNPGPFTGPGTNTWLVGQAPAAVVVDPGPASAEHLGAIERALGGVAVGAVLVTHGHADHLEGAATFAARHRARVSRFPELDDGDVISVGEISLAALHTPGHSPDHLCFWMPGDRILFSGDLVLGRGSSMVTYPDGDVAAYLRSLERVATLAPRILFPGHWDPVLDAPAKLAEYREHRLARERQVLAAAREAPGTASELTERVYGSELASEPALRRAAEMTLRAHLRKLVEDGVLRQAPSGSTDAVYSAA